ncbi:HAD-IIA family hydrolase [Corynebacterium sp. LK2510]|uniref:HAD-IIA family hydrolase n=1 Tax=Corynebacterium sp. LK2510 TaxID=3110472 RepID=UPI0034CDE6F9
MLIDTIDALLLDLDGTVWEGGRSLPHTPEIIGDATVPVVFVTNNAFRHPTLVATILNDMGIKAGAEQVYTSAGAALGLARERVGEGAQLLVIGSDSFKDLARDAGFVLVDSADDDPAAVLHGHNPETGWKQLSEAAVAIQRGAVYLATNLDTSLPTERGFLVGNGSMVAAVTSVTGVTPEAAGKPQPVMFHQAVRDLGAKRPLAVGDRLDTDIAGAVAAGIPSLHVLTGVSGPHALIGAPKEQRPTYIGKDFSALREGAEQLLPGPQGGFQARIDYNGIVLSGGGANPDPLAALRTVLQVAWDMSAAPTEVRPESAAAEEACAQWW